MVANVLVVGSDRITSEITAEALDVRHETWAMHDIRRACIVLRSRPIGATVLAHSDETGLHVRELKTANGSVPIVLMNAPAGFDDSGEIGPEDLEAVVDHDDSPEDLRRIVDRVCGRE